MRINENRHASGGSTRGHGPQGTGADAVRGDDPAGPRLAGVPRATPTDRSVPPGGRDTTKHARPGRSAQLVALTSSVPVLIAALLVAGVPQDIGFQVIAGWSLAQFLVVMLLVERPARGGEPRGESESECDDTATAAAAAQSWEDDAAREADRLHEVRTTMAGIGLTHRLLRDGRDRISGADRSRLELMYDREISRLERLLLVDAPAGEETVDVHSTVDPVVDSLRLRGQRISWEGTQALAAGRADDVAEIVHILLHNALRHAPGSEVSMEVESTPTDVLLRVSDDGPGVPIAIAPDLFGRGIRRPDSPGEGIGLQIARRLAREMGGDLHLDSSSNRRGAAFILTLRACAETAPCPTLQG